MKKGTKVFVAALALVLVFGAVVGGTLAWLQSTSKTITNTFTVGNVSIALNESGLAEDETEKDFKMIPGNKIAKDPQITVNSGSEACWLFVEVTESDNLGTYIDYDIADGWTELSAGVYYREVADLTADEAEDVIINVLASDDTMVDDTKPYANGYVTVKGTVTAADMTAAESDAPELTFTAYAVQKANVASAADACSIAKTGDLPAQG